MLDIIDRLIQDAGVLESHRYTTAADAMREAAHIIASLRWSLAVCSDDWDDDEMSSLIADQERTAWRRS